MGDRPCGARVCVSVGWLVIAAMYSRIVGAHIMGVCGTFALALFVDSGVTAAVADP